jgi:putative hydrolase of HD superfamily
MDASPPLQLLLDAHRLKRIPRTGWVMHGVASAESVADHSFGVAFISLILAEMLNRPLDKAKLLTIAQSGDGGPGRVAT